MRSKSKIVVLHLKEVIYTGIFILLGILFLVLLFLMFSPKSKDTMLETDSSNKYIPGKYTTTLEFSGNLADVEVVVDQSAITAISLENLEESVSVMYPLMEPALDSISTQILETQSLDNITYPEESKYTSMVLLNAIANCLEQANPQ